MEATGNQLRRRTQRLKSYPILLAKCSETASRYAACVTKDFNVRKDACAKEFQLFKDCIRKTAQEMKLKI